ncbi:PhbF [Olavius algarvensis associated proteobacterium Delta 3]|nr:PhbF [Olavius algarvensis associated proteobacterium Delta 3]CAB5134630.1 PhbF [Olavius algarvensis associated proteobacterium Delta 3]
MADTVILKKYANRRLYDTEASAYVTLQEVADMIRMGRQVRVLEAKTKEDVTGFILTQIILEEAKKKNALLPVPLLHLIIQFGDNLLGDFFDSYLQQIIQAYLSQKVAFEDQFKDWIGMGMNFPEMARKGVDEMGGLKSFFELNPFMKKSRTDRGDT